MQCETTPKTHKGASLVYGSVCSGIEAATVAWHPLGWKPAFFSEIDNFPRAVLAHHYPDMPLHGDFTTIQEHDYDPIDLLVGGTPCQAFSVAGLRKGFADERGNLTLEFVRLAQRLKPRWLVWENVPGVLSIDRGRAFGSFLGGLAELGYGFAYRVLDAQHFGVPQRRRRVFVVGYLGDWRPPAAVLFEREGLLRDLTPRRETGQSVAALTATGVGTCGADDNQGQAGHLVAGTISAAGSRSRGAGSDPAMLTASTGDIAHCLNAGGMGSQDYETETLIAHTLRAEGFDASEDGTGRGTPLVPVACFKGGQGSQDRSIGLSEHLAPTLPSADSGSNRTPTLMQGMAVRRLTPRECERLQGFPNDYTLVPYRGKPAVDGPRYKALGNSMAVPCMRWIGERIQMVESIRAKVAA